MERSGEALPLRPLPLADDFTAGFWQAANEGRLAIQRCAKCRTWQHAPGILCPTCGSEALAFETVSGKATLFSWSVIKEAPAPGFRDMLPLIVGMVELVEQPHLLLMANILGASEGELKLGMALQAEFENLTDDCAVPQFRAVRG